MEWKSYEFIKRLKSSSTQLVDLITITDSVGIQCWSIWARFTMAGFEWETGDNQKRMIYKHDRPCPKPFLKKFFLRKGGLTNNFPATSLSNDNLVSLPQPDNMQNLSKISSKKNKKIIRCEPNDGCQRLYKTNSFCCTVDPWMPAKPSSSDPFQWTIWQFTVEKWILTGDEWLMMVSNAQ